MRAFFAWAIEDKLVTLDPTKGVKLLPGPNDADGFHTWTQALIVSRLTGQSARASAYPTIFYFIPG